MYYSKGYLTLTNTLYLLRGRWWPIVCTPSGAVLNGQKGVLPEQYVACCQPQPILIGIPGYQWYTCYMKFPNSLPDTGHQS